MIEILVISQLYLSTLSLSLGHSFFSPKDIPFYVCVATMHLLES